MPEISLIICTHNRAQLLISCLKTVSEQDLPPELFEVVVADDGSTDETPQAAQNYSPRFSFTYLQLPKCGRSAARNAALKAAQGKFVVFVDDDVFLPRHFLAVHYQIQQKGDKIIGRGPIIDIDQPEFPENLTAKLQDYSTAPFCTCNASVNRESFLAAGGFDEDFKVYGWEDNEAGLRLLKNGYQIVFKKEAFIYHYRPLWKKTSLAVMRQKAQEMGATAALFYQKHPTLRVKLATGDYFLIKAWGALTANSWINKYLTKLWEKGVSPGLEKFIARRIFLHDYLKAMAQAQKGFFAKKEN